MDKPIEHYWEIRLAEVKQALEANNFEVFLANSACISFINGSSGGIFRMLA